jgi:hypothetical protein
MRDEYTGSPSYRDFLARQKESVLIDILGPSRYAAYKAGTPIDRFVKDGKVLTLEEMKLVQLSRKEVLKIFDPEDVIPHVPDDGDREYINTFLDREGQKVESLEKEAEYVMNVGIKAGNNREFASIVSTDGTIIKTIEGTAREIPMTDSFINELKNMKPDSIYLIHFHTSGCSFSPEDLNALCGLPSIRQMQILTASRTLYKMKIPKNAIIPEEAPFLRSCEVLIKAMKEKYEPKIRSGEMTKSRRDILISRELSTILKNRYHWIYDMEELNG